MMDESMHSNQIKNREKGALIGWLPPPVTLPKGRMYGCVSDIAKVVVWPSMARSLSNGQQQDCNSPHLFGLGDSEEAAICDPGA